MAELTITIPNVERCPFCNSESCASVQKQSSLNHIYYAVICNNCGANGPRSYSDKETFPDENDYDIRNICAKAWSISKWNNAIRGEESPSNE